MNTYKVVVDRQCTVWERQEYTVKARSMASAIRRVDEGDGWDAKGVQEHDCETLYDTMEGTGDVEVMENECERID